MQIGFRVYFGLSQNEFFGFVVIIDIVLNARVIPRRDLNLPKGSTPKPKLIYGFIEVLFKGFASATPILKPLFVVRNDWDCLPKVKSLPTSCLRFLRLFYPFHQKRAVK